MEPTQQPSLKYANGHICHDGSLSLEQLKEYISKVHVGPIEVIWGHSSIETNERKSCTKQPFTVIFSEAKRPSEEEKNRADTILRMDTSTLPHNIFFL